MDEGYPALANGRRNANNRQNAVFEMSLIGGFACLRSAIYYGLLKLECRSWNVAGWTRVIPRLRTVNRTPFLNQNAVLMKTPFINTKRLSGARANVTAARGKQNAVHRFIRRSTCGARQTKRRSPFYSPFDVRRATNKTPFTVLFAVRRAARDKQNAVHRSPFYPPFAVITVMAIFS